MVRDLKTLMTAMIAFWGLMAAFGNVMSLGAAYTQVTLVTSMADVAEAGGPVLPWATSNPLVAWLGVATIVGSKLGAGIFCSIALVKMVSARRGETAAFVSAKQWAVFGTGFGALLLFGGFTVFGEFVFMMWMSPKLAGAADMAARYGMMLAVLTIFLAQPEPEA
ncbi:MAG: DUF2165 family protein [Pseudomonadota bacterium]